MQKSKSSLASRRRGIAATTITTRGGEGSSYHDGDDAANSSSSTLTTTTTTTTTKKPSSSSSIRVGRAGGGGKKKTADLSESSSHSQHSQEDRDRVTLRASLTVPLVHGEVIDAAAAARADLNDTKQTVSQMRASLSRLEGQLHEMIVALDGATRAQAEQRQMEEDARVAEAREWIAAWRARGAARIVEDLATHALPPGHGDDDENATQSEQGEEEERPTPKRRMRVAIIGAGPAGLACALIMANLRGCDVHVFERRKDPSKADLNQAFVYNIDARGRKVLELIDHEDGELMDDIESRSVPAGGKLMLKVATPDGTITPSEVTFRSKRTKSLWLPRQALVDALLNAVKRAPRIALHTGSAPVVKISDDLTTVTMDEEKGVVVKPHLIVAADGARSATRQAMEDADGARGHFEPPVMRASPAANLKYKVLVLSDQFRFVNDAAEVAKDGSSMISVRGAVTDGPSRMRLGLLPVRPPQRRTANIIAYDDHVVWEHMSTVRGAERYLENMFPQVDWSKALEPGELDRFVAASGGHFPTPQAPNRLAYVPLHRDSYKRGDEECVAAVLIGDAAHCFPPDLGQGVNSALEDVLVLDEALEHSRDLYRATSPVEIGRYAATRYRRKREPDARALVNLVAVGYPWQYSQPGRIQSFRTKLWTLNYLLRAALHRALPAWFWPACFLMVQNFTDESYGTIWRRAQRTTWRIVVLLVTVLGAAIVSVMRSASMFGAAAV